VQLLLAVDVCVQSAECRVQSAAVAGCGYVYVCRVQLLLTVYVSGEGSCC
jgi:hypothetical protein